MRPLTRSAWAFLFALFFILISIMAICALPASASNYDPSYNYNLFKLSEATFSSRLADDSSSIVSSNGSNAVTGWFPVQYGKYYSFTALYNGVRTHYIKANGSFPCWVRLNIKCSDGSIVVYSTDSAEMLAIREEIYSTGAFRVPVENAVEMRIHFNTLEAGVDLALSKDAFAVFEPMIVEGDSAAEAFSNSKGLKYIDGDATPYTYSVVYNGGYGLTFRSFSQSCTLDLIVDSKGFQISVDGYEDDYNYSASEFNSDYQQFAGLSYQGDEELADYTVGNSYEITLTPSNPSLSLTSVFKHSLYVDPAGGTWNNSSDVSVIWDYFGSDYDQIYNPTREGYVFDGWTFSGSGDFSSAGNPPYTYTFGNAAGYLAANWVGDPALKQSATITIEGTPYTFTDYGVMPSVQLTVTSSGAVMSYGSQSYTFTYSGSGTFTGFSFGETGDPMFLIGETIELAACDHILYCCVKAAPSTYILKAGQWECKSLIMTGEYIDLPVWPSGLGSVPFSFVSSGQSFSSMSVGTYLPTSQTQLLYGSSAAYRYPLGDLSGGFTNSAFAFVYLTSDQVVPKEFYDWFVASFNRVSDSPVSPTFSTVVNLYDSSGLILYATYTISGSGTSPIATGTVLANGVEFVDASGKKWSWTLAPNPFLGFSFGNDSYAAVYPPGSTFEVGGVYSDFILNLYLTLKPDDSQYQSGVLGLLERIFDALRPSSWLDFLDLVDFGFIGDIFSTAYRGLNGFFGLQNFVNDPAGPFGWLKG